MCQGFKLLEKHGRARLLVQYDEQVSSLWVGELADGSPAVARMAAWLGRLLAERKVCRDHALEAYGETSALFFGHDPVFARLPRFYPTAEEAAAAASANAAHAAADCDEDGLDALPGQTQAMLKELLDETEGTGTEGAVASGQGTGDGHCRPATGHATWFGRFLRWLFDWRLKREEVCRAD